MGASSIREIELDGDVLQLDVLRGEEAAEHIDLETARLEPIASAVVAACLGANRVASSLRVRTRDLGLTSCATLAEAVRGHPSAYLPYISPISPLYLPYISPVSP